MAKLLLCLARIRSDSESTWSAAGASAAARFVAITLSRLGLWFFDLRSKDALVVSDAAGDRLFLFNDLNLGARSRLAGFAVNGINEQLAVAEWSCRSWSSP